MPFRQRPHLLQRALIDNSAILSDAAKQRLLSSAKGSSPPAGGFGSSSTFAALKDVSEIVIGPGSPLVGNTLHDYRLPIPGNVAVLDVFREGRRPRLDKATTSAPSRRGDAARGEILGLKRRLRQDARRWP